MKLTIEQAESVTEELIGMERGERLKAVEKLTESYDEHDEKALEQLTNALLHEELSDGSKTKMTDEEYPILSETQYQRRASGRQRRRNSAGVTDQEVPLTHLANYATDGFDYTPPIRNFTNPW